MCYWESSERIAGLLFSNDCSQTILSGSKGTTQVSIERLKKNTSLNVSDCEHFLSNYHTFFLCALWVFIDCSLERYMACILHYFFLRISHREEIY
jgi:hypothetical protein